MWILGNCSLECWLFDVCDFKFSKILFTDTYISSKPKTQDTLGHCPADVVFILGNIPVASKEVRHVEQERSNDTIN